MSYEHHIQEDRRLVILRLLAEARSYDMNSAVLQTALADFGHHPSRDQLHTELAWLVEQGLVHTREMASVLVSRITPRGIDVAMGRAQVPGIKRPGPVVLD